MKKNLQRIVWVLLISALILAASYFRLLEVFELQTQDIRFKLRGQRPQNPDIAIIEIADDSLEKIGRWPFERIWHAQLIDTLASLGVRQIGFDIIFTEESVSDAEFIAAAARAGNVYFPLTFPISPPLLPRLREAAKGTGHINIIPDIDGKRRKIPLFIKHNERSYPQMALVMARDYLGVPLENIKVPLNKEGEMLINYAGRWTETFRHYSYVDVLTSYAQMAKGEEPFIPLAELKGKTCFIGLTATGTHDLNPVPLESRYPMVGVQVNIFNSLVQGDFISRATKEVNIIILLFLILLGAGLVVKTRPWIGAFLISLLIIAYALTAHILFAYFGIYIDIVLPFAVIFFAYLGLVFSRYLNAKRAEELMSQELEIARKIQGRFLPQGCPRVAGVEIAARMTAAHKIGGDFYDFVKIDEHRLGVLIGDVSGKGIPAALYMATTVSNFRSEIKLHKEANRVLEKVNQDLCQGVSGGGFASALYLILDLQEGRIVFSNAGHMPLLTTESDTESEPPKSEIRPRERVGLPLGIHSDTVYTTGEMRLASGEALVFYTDGLVESQNQKREFFGEERLRAIVKDTADLTAQDMVDNIIEEVEKFSKGLPQFDDLTLVVVKKK